MTRRPDRSLCLAGVALTLGLGLATAPALAAEDGAPEVAFSFTDPRIDESSGLVDLGDLMVTTNDSGDDGIVYVLDPATGDTVGTTSYGTATDVEALAPAGRRAVWVADIGDNSGVRGSVTVARVPVGRGDRTVVPETYELAYPDGAKDAEALLVHPRTGRLYVASKVLFGGTLYAAPQRLETGRVNRLRRVGGVGGVVTDGAFWPDGRHLVLRGYGEAVIHAFPGLERVAVLSLPEQDQGEGLSVSPDGVMHVSSEGAGADVWRVPLPDDVRRQLDTTTPAAEPSSAPDPVRPAPEALPSSAGVGWSAGWVAAAVLLMGVLGGAVVGIARRR